MYNKLFTKILDSSIWLEADATRIVWITLIAAMDEDGMARFSSVANLAHRARESIRATEKAVAVLEAADPNSDREEYQGKRIERVPGGWLVLNAAYYRSIVSRHVIKEQTKMRVQRYRERCNGEIVTGVTCNDSPASAYVDVSSSSKEGSPEGNQPWIEKLRAIYTWVNFDQEIAKARAHLLQPRCQGRKFTQKYFTAWLNRIDRPLETPRKEWRPPAPNWKEAHMSDDNDEDSP